MTEKIAWLEEVLHLEPNSKLFFPLAQAYARDRRPNDAVDVLRKGLAFYPEHLGARLLLIECLSEMGTASWGAPSSAEAAPGVESPFPPEMESLTAALTEHPAFWRHWAASSRAQGRTDLAVTLDMLAVQLGGSRITWGSLLEQGLRAVTGGRDAPLPPAPMQEQPPPLPDHGPLSPPGPELEPACGSWPPVDREAAPEPAAGPDRIPDPSPESDLQSEPRSSAAVEEPIAAAAGREDEDLETHVAGDARPFEDEAREVSKGGMNEDQPDASEVRGQATWAPLAEPETAEAPGPAAEVETPLSEGERRYYETKTYADLLAKQGEHTEALDLYAKLLQTSPDDEQRLDLEARILELRDRVAKGARETLPDPAETRESQPLPESKSGSAEHDAPEDTRGVSASPPPTPSPKTAATRQTLKKLAERLEARAGK